jgi:hypothetical protein
MYSKTSSSNSSGRYVANTGVEGDLGGVGGEDWYGECAVMGTTFFDFMVDLGWGVAVRELR